MDILAKQLFHKAGEFRFHKKLSSGLTRWRCEKYNCNAYVKTNGPENVIIFENLNHTHAVDNDDQSRSIINITRDNEVDLHSIPAEVRINDEKSQESKMQLIKQEKKLPITKVHLSNQECENNSKFKRHGDLLPQHVRLICVGRSNCGKTTALLSLIYNREGLWFENIYIFSKTLYQPKYQELESVLENIPEIDFFKYPNAKSVPSLEEVKPNSIMIFDDIASEPGKNRHLQSYFSMARHKHVDTIFLNQSYTNIFKHLVRENANMILIFRQDNLNLKHIFDDHVTPDMKFGKFCEMCSLAWNSSAHGCLLICKECEPSKGRYGSLQSWF